MSGVSAGTSELTRMILKNTPLKFFLDKIFCRSVVFFSGTEEYL